MAHTSLVIATSRTSSFFEWNSKRFENLQVSSVWSQLVLMRSTPSVLDRTNACKKNLSYYNYCLTYTCMVYLESLLFTIIATIFFLCYYDPICIYLYSGQNGISSHRQCNILWNCAAVGRTRRPCLQYRQLYGINWFMAAKISCHFKFYCALLCCK